MFLSSKTKNKQIAKNSVFLYIRMFISMAITLYTSRVVLQALGIDNYGIYNVVGGIVTMFSAVYASLSVSISRFITFALGEGDAVKLAKTFVTAVNVQILLSIVALILAESVGMWFMHSYMNIPLGKMELAEWVLHFSVATTIVNLISIPYNALIVAHEKMAAFAYISIIEVTMKLLIAYIVIFSSYNHLFIYALLLFILALIIRIIYGSYCRKKFLEARYTFAFYFDVFKDMSSFAGWNFFGNLSNIASGQGTNMLINVFFGVSFNAARGIANQVESAVNQFVNSFSMAFMPQITKSYASGELGYMCSLIRVSTKYSRILILFPIVPLIVETEFILSMWLNVVPDQTVIFVKIILTTSFVTVVSSTLVSSIFATGKIKCYQLILSIIHFLIFPVVWLFFYIGFPAWTCFIVAMFFYLIANIWRLSELKRLVAFPFLPYLIDAFLKPVIVFAIALFVCFGINQMVQISILRLFINTISSSIVILAASYVIVLGNKEKQFILKQVSFIIDRIKTVK